MDSHLVSVKVSVECGTYKRMQFDRTTLYQDRFKRLNTKSVQCRCTVQHNRMLFNDVLKDIPYLRLKTFYHLLGIFNIVRGAVGNQLFHYKRFKQLNRHLFGQTTLIDLQFRSYNDNGTSGIVYTFTKQVLTETSGFTLQHVGKRFQRTVARSCYRTAAAAIIDQRVYSLLKHTLLVADNDIRCMKLDEAFQTVVSVDDPAVQIIQVGGSKTASIQLYHGSEIRRDHGDHGHDHPFRFVPGFTEGFHNLQTFDDPCSLLTGGLLQTLFQFFGFLLHVDGFQKLLDSLCTHSYTETVSPFIISFLILSLCEYLLVCQVGLTFVQDNIVCKIQHLLQCSRRKIQHQTHTARNTFEIPDMGNRSSQLDMAHPLTAHACLGNLNTTAVADYAFITDLLVFSTVTLPVFAGSEDTLTEQTVTLRLQGSVVDGFRLEHLPVRPLSDLFRGCQADFDCVKCNRLITVIFN